MTYTLSQFSTTLVRGKIQLNMKMRTSNCTRAGQNYKKCSLRNLLSRLPSRKGVQVHTFIQAKRMKWSEGARSKSSGGTTPRTIESNAELHVNSVTRQTSVVPEEIDSPHNGPRPMLRLNQFSPTNAMPPFTKGFYPSKTELITCSKVTQELDEG